MNPNNLLSYKHFRSGAAWIILFIGIGLYYLGYFQVENDSIWKEIIIKIADVLVIGVLLGYLSNAAQFLGVFKQDLQDIVYGKEFLKKRNDISTLWETVSKQLFKEKFPAISKDLLSAIKESYLPLNEVSYYNDYNVIIELSWADDAHEFIIAKDTVNFDLITESPNKFELPLSSWINIDGLNSDEYYIKIVEYTINGEQITNSQEKSEVDSKHQIYKHKCTIELSGHTKYEITQRQERRYMLAKDFHISFRAKHIINKLNVQLRYPDDINVDFLCRGTIKDFKDVNSSNGYIEKQYKGIILPRQGYVFVLNKKR